MLTEQQRSRYERQLRRLQYAERVTRILCWRSGPEIVGFKWRRAPASWRDQNRLLSHRSPPLPFHSTIHKGAGFCRVCGQPIYGGGSFRSFAGAPSKRLTWHTLCTEVYFVMTRPTDYIAPLLLRQREACAVTGESIPLPYSKTVEVDHEIPLYRVARDHAEEPWCELIRFWMSGNLRVITRSAHVAKSATEAVERSGNAGQIGMEV